MTRVQRWCRWSGGLVAIMFALASILTVARPSAAQTAPPDPATEVLAVLSPIASPACSASGSATLLVPIVGGLVNQQLDKSVPSVADLILNALGPVYVACGQLPAAPGTRCQIDDQIAGLVPTEISSVTGPTPGLLGDLTDALNAGLQVLGLPPSAALQQALVCEIPAGAGAVDAPTAAPSAPPPAAAPGAGTAPVAIGQQPAGRLPSPAGTVTPSTTTTTTPTTAAPPTRTVAEAIAERVPGGLRTLQVAFGLALALYLASSWAASWREARRSPASAA